LPTKIAEEWSAAINDARSFVSEMTTDARHRKMMGAIYVRDVMILRRRELFTGRGAAMGPTVVQI